MARQNSKQAVAYCRVSSPGQTKRGDGLNSQETRCREYAKYRDHEIIKVFVDDVTGRHDDRSGLIAMLEFLRKNRSSNYVVIIDDISRLARNLEQHIRLHKTIAAAGGHLESPSIEFGEDADSKLVEHLLASVSEHQSHKNA